MITKPLSPEEFLEQFRTGKIGYDSNEIAINEQTVEGGKLTVYVSITEDYWPYPFVFKRHHVYPTRSVIVEFNVASVKNGNMHGTLADNNGFAKESEMEGKRGKFPKGQLIEKQNWEDQPEKLGKWNRAKDEIPDKCPWGDPAFDKQPEAAEQ